MKAMAVFHYRFWRTLDWKSLLLLFIALCVIGFDLVGRLRAPRHSLARRGERAEAALAPGERNPQLRLRRLYDPEGSALWQRLPVEGAASQYVESFSHSSPPPGYVVMRVEPRP